MDGLFSKALDVLDSTLNEYPKPAESASISASLASDSAHDVSFAPSAVSDAERVLHFWEELDLESKKVVLDENGVTISQNQESSTRNRKSLSDQTRAFKSGEKKDVAPLLKSYQGEIDSLTKRAKFAETAYLNVYQMLYDAPDVVPMLKSFADVIARAAAAEQETRRYKQELEVTKKEAAAGKSLQATVRRLEERNAELEEELMVKAEEMLEERQEEWGKSIEELHERERSLHAQLEESRDNLASSQRLHDKAESLVFDLKSKLEDDRAGKQHELDALTEEFERAQERAAGLERLRQELEGEIERLRRGVEGGEGDDESAHAKSLLDLEDNLSSKEKLISSLHKQVQQLEHTLAAEREANEERVRQLQEECEEMHGLREALQAELGGRPTVAEVDDLRKQMRILQELVGSDVDEEWAANQDDHFGDGSEASIITSALKVANRKLKAEVTGAKMALAERDRQLEEAAASAVSLESQNAELQVLVNRLEDDLMKGSSNAKEMLQRRDEWKTGGVAAVMTDLLNGPHEAEELALPGPALSSSAEAEAEEGSMLEIVVGQRERLRKRVKELEEETGRLRETIARRDGEAQQLKNDNVNLYEKIKYVEQYNRQNVPIRRLGAPDIVVFGGAGAGGASKSSRYACFSVPDGGAHPDALSMSQDAGLSSEMRYRKLYEERMNPFNEFHEKEQERSYKNLRLHDKITLSGGRFFLSSNYGRLFIFFYTILLHVLIFFILYRNMHSRTVIVEHVGPAAHVNGTLAGSEIPQQAAHTVGDTLAEKMGQLLQTTRDLTTQGSGSRSLRLS
eukprot:jgi/Mesen1/1096/ME000123S00274